MSNPTPFSSLDLEEALLSNLADIAYAEMTLVQAETLPHLLGGADAPNMDRHISRGTDKLLSFHPQAEPRSIPSTPLARWRPISFLQGRDNPRVLGS